MREESFGAELRRLTDELLKAYAGSPPEAERLPRSKGEALSDIHEAGLDVSDFLRDELERRGDRDVVWLGEVVPATELLDRFEGDLRETYELALHGSSRTAFDLKNVALQLVRLAELAHATRERGRQIPWVSDRKRRRCRR